MAGGGGRLCFTGAREERQGGFIGRATLQGGFSLSSCAQWRRHGAEEVGDVRRADGQWWKAVRARACARRARGTDLGVGSVSRPVAHSAHGTRPRTAGFSGVSACAFARVRRRADVARVARCRAVPVPWLKSVSSDRLQNEFSPNFQTKVHQSLNTKLA
jgi:hypothetical protein